MKKIISAFLIIIICAFSISCEKKQNAKETITLTYWSILNDQAALSFDNYGDTPFAKELQKKTGVRLEYQHPMPGKTTNEKFNMMIALNNLPDIVEYGWANYPGGPARAIRDHKIIDLTPILPQHADELSDYLKNNDEIAKLCRTDEGQYFGFPFIRGDESLCVWQGIVIRQDWLDDLNLPMPKTIADWDRALEAFKNKKGAQEPFSTVLGEGFLSAYKLQQGFYIDDGIVKYYANEDGYEKYLEQIYLWHKKGYLSKDIVWHVSDNSAAPICSGVSGAALGSVGANMGSWMKEATEEKMVLSGVPYPVLNDGDIAEYGQHDTRVPNCFTAITTSCKNIEAACKVLSYGYTTEGHMLFNFGIEGKSYELKNGEPVYTKLITNNPDGLTMSGAMSLYMKSFGNGMMIQDKRYMEQYANSKQQQLAWKEWGNNNAGAHVMPYVYSDAKESNDIDRKVEQINNYVYDMSLKFISGLIPLTEYPSFKSELKNMGIDEVLSSKQRGYARYLNR